jgi:hypothetical protein
MIADFAQCVVLVMFCRCFIILMTSQTPRRHKVVHWSFIHLPSFKTPRSSSLTRRVYEPVTHSPAHFLEICIVTEQGQPSSKLGEARQGSRNAEAT